MKKNKKEIVDYDNMDTSEMIDEDKALKLADLGLKVPSTPLTQVVSIAVKGRSPVCR